MKNQKHLFQLPENVHFLNCAYMSPIMKSVEEAGIEGIQRKRNPIPLVPAKFFDEIEQLKQTFGLLIQAEAKQIAIIPSASYGLENAISNVPCQRGQHGLLVSDTFPSGYFAAKNWSKKHQTEIITIEVPNQAKKGAFWNEKILQAINEQTAFVLLSHIHWMYGTQFQLDEISKRCQEFGTYLIIDGTQSVGALEIDVKALQIDALICSGYKWLLGPYSMGLAYYNERFNQGIPIENSWMNRLNSVDFAHLTNYEENYSAGAGRYNVGQTSNFIHTPMLLKSIEQILEWKVDEIQNYVKKLNEPLLDFLANQGFEVEDEKYRANHLLSFQLPQQISSENLLNEFKKHQLYLSVRGTSLRISPHVYNTEDDIQQLIHVLSQQEI
jgi:selenocysteine lyase/cysteine desulfurase